ncbi:hypothetical protein [Roseivirga sp. UBA838]|uniref:hypothetical protein n=1 Tax=Roseivirga sp. UBA838 TaxID=1947393 RepID=UPI00257A5C01|nr:hypothetical protein [Roseivirga sp. UBA838]
MTDIIQDLDPKQVITTQWLANIAMNDYETLEALLELTGTIMPSDILVEHEGKTIGQLLEDFNDNTF